MLHIIQIICSRTPFRRACSATRLIMSVATASCSLSVSESARAWHEETGQQQLIGITKIKPSTIHQHPKNQYTSTSRPMLTHNSKCISATWPQPTIRISTHGSNDTYYHWWLLVINGYQWWLIMMINWLMIKWYLSSSTAITQELHNLYSHQKTIIHRRLQPSLTINHFQKFDWSCVAALMAFLLHDARLANQPTDASQLQSEMPALRAAKLTPHISQDPYLWNRVQVWYPVY